jgi:FkbM family methyltransferase
VKADSGSAFESGGHYTKSRLVAASKFPMLTSLLGDAGIRLVDIGGRGSALRPLTVLAPFSDYYVAEPDRTEAERLKQHLPQQAPWRTVNVIAAAIASRRGEANLYLTKAPGMSSLLKPDAHVTQRLCVGHKFRVASVITVPIVPLDDAASQYGFRDACFLKLDTQGTELDILKSGARLVDESVLGVYTECTFHPFYTGQSLFSDVDVWLREHGFVLVSLSRTNLRRANYRPSLYSRRVTAWAHCLYLREPDQVLKTFPGDLRRQVTRLLALALAFEQYDLALELTALIRRVRILPDEDGKQLAGEMRLHCRESTRRIAKKAQAEHRADVVMAASYRDKSHVE